MSIPIPTPANRRSCGRLAHAGHRALRATACAIVAAILLSAPPAGAQDPAPGRLLFTANGCYQCHGYDGQGGVAGPRIAPSPYPYIAFAQLVRRPANAMPAYAPAVLGDSDLREIWAYVRSIAEPPPLEQIPALR
jgi:mono/diheme cytochrome c family protein